MRPDAATALSLALSTAAVSIPVLRVIDLNEKEHVWALALMMWLGVISAAVASLLSSQRLGHETALAIALTAELATGAAVGLGMLVLIGVGRLRGLSEINGVVDMLIFGAAAGVGFAIGDMFLRETFASAQEVQNPLQTSPPGLVWMSLQSALSQALFGAILGAAGGKALQARLPLESFALALAGLSAAIFAHLGYVALFLKGAPIAPDLTAPAALAMLFIAIAAVSAVLLGLRAERHAILAELSSEVDGEILTPKEWDRFKHEDTRRRAYAKLFLTGDIHAWLQQRRLQDLQVKLSLTKRRGLRAPPPKRARLAAETQEIRDRIRRLRRNALQNVSPLEPGNMPRRDPRARLLSLPVVALVSGGVLAAGVVIIAVASGTEAPTTLATRSSQFERKRIKSAVRDARPVLVDWIAPVVGNLRLVAARRDDRLLGRGADQAYLAEYTAGGGHELRYALASFPSHAQAERHRNEVAGGSREERRVWVNGSTVSAASGQRADVSEFCGEVPPDRRPNELPDFRAAITGALPTSWTQKGSATRFAISTPEANIIGSSEFYGNQVSMYAQLQGNELAKELARYREISVRKVKLGTRTGLRRDFEWTAPTHVRQAQLYIVDCGAAYTFTVTTAFENYGRYAAVFDRAFSALATIE